MCQQHKLDEVIKYLKKLKTQKPFSFIINKLGADLIILLVFGLCYRIAYFSYQTLICIVFFVSNKLQIAEPMGLILFFGIFPKKPFENELRRLGVALSNTCENDIRSHPTGVI